MELDDDSQALVRTLAGVTGASEEEVVATALRAYYEQVARTKSDLPGAQSTS
jgi:hypothetical protein